MANTSRLPAHDDPPAMDVDDTEINIADDQLPDIYTRPLLVCQHCIHSQLKALKPKNQNRILGIFWVDCESTFRSSIARCSHCYHNDIRCVPIPRGMSGDCKDFFEIHAFVVGLWRLRDLDGAPWDPAQHGFREFHQWNEPLLLDHTEFWFSDSTRRGLEVAVWKFMMGFATAMKSHCREYNFRLYKAPEWITTMRYEKAMNSRSLILASLYSNTQNMNNNGRLMPLDPLLLRLEQSDIGYANLSSSKERLFNTVKDLMLQDKRGLTLDNDCDVADNENIGPSAYWTA